MGFGQITKGIQKWKTFFIFKFRKIRTSWNKFPGRRDLRSGKSGRDCEKSSLWEPISKGDSENPFKKNPKLF